MIRVEPIRCNGVTADEEENELDMHTKALEDEIAERTEKLTTLRAWKQERVQARAAEAAKQKATAEREKRKREEEDESTKRVKLAEQTRADELRKQRARGTKMHYWLEERNQEIADDWDGHHTSCIAMGCCGDEDSGSTLLMLEDTKDFYYSAGLPDDVQKELQGKHKLNQSYIALGTHGRYFMKRSTGWTQWDAGGNEDFKKYVEEVHRDDEASD